MKKIWIMNHYAIPTNMGGITRQFDYAVQLVKRGYDVTIFASSFDSKLRIEKLEKHEKYRVEIIEGVRFIWIKTYPYKRNDYKRFINMLSFAFMSYLVGRKQDRPDTIIASSVHLFTCISGYFLSKNKKCRYIAEIRDLWPKVLIDMGAIKKNSLKAKVFFRLEKFVYKRAEKIVIVLAGMKDYIKSMGIDENKIIHIPNGVVIDKYDNTLDQKKLSEEVLKIKDHHINKFKILYLGAMGQANGLSNVINASKIILDRGYENISILMIGDGTEKDKLIKEAEEIDVQNIFFYNPLKKDEIPMLLNCIDICLFNLADIDAYKDGISPNKLFDYLYSGKPVLFACTTKDDIVKKANAGISVQAENPEKLAKAIIEFYYMPRSKRDELGENGRTYIREHHDIAVLADRFEEII